MSDRVNKLNRKAASAACRVLDSEGAALAVSVGILPERDGMIGTVVVAAPGMSPKEVLEVLRGTLAAIDAGRTENVCTCPKCTAEKLLDQIT